MSGLTLSAAVAMVATPETEYEYAGCFLRAKILPKLHDVDVLISSLKIASQVLYRYVYAGYGTSIPGRHGYVAALSATAVRNIPGSLCCDGKMPTYGVTTDNEKSHKRSQLMRFAHQQF